MIVSWFVVNDSRKKKSPKWARSVAVTKDGENIFIPAVIVGSEDIVFTKILFDGEFHIRDEKHLYIPLNWALEEYPEYIDDLRNIESKVNQAIIEHQKSPD